jgi:hypothetical protein
MNLPKQTAKAFIFWLVVMALGVVTYMVYLGRPGIQFVQIALLLVPVTASIIYLLFRATQIGKEFAMILAVLWFFAPPLLSNLMPSVDQRLVLLILLAISLSMNLALSLILRRRKALD